MILMLANVVALVLCGISAFHIFWAMGGRWGASGTIPERAGAPLFRPGAAACVIVAILLLVAAFVVHAKARNWSEPILPHGWPTACTLLVALVFVARAVGDFRWVGFFKSRRGTRFARLDDLFYSPLCLLLGIGSLIVSLAS